MNASPPSSLRPALRRAVWLVITIYLTIVVMLSLFQRSLMYFPDRVAAIEPADAGLPRGQVHTVSCRSADGLELRGWLVLADGQAARDEAECGRRLADGRLCVVYFSGNAGNRRWRGDEFRAFTAAGCDVIVFDYRGYGENPGAPTEAGLAADARAVWQYVTEERHVAPRRVVLFGESLGGAVAVRLAAEVSAVGTPPGGLIVRSSFSSMVDVAAKHYPWLPVRWVLVDRYRSADRIGAVTCPLLHLHGQQDTIVPIRFGRKLFAAAPAQSADGVAKTMVELPAADHNDILDVAGREYRRAIREFVDRLRTK